MSLTTQIEQDYIAAYKAKDALRLGVLRLLKTAAKNLQVELMRPVTDAELAGVIQKQAKQRHDELESFYVPNMDFEKWQTMLDKTRESLKT